jgi:hypothetical protein
VSVANSHSRGDREFEKVTAMLFPSKVAQRGRITGPLPEALRYHPELKYESGDWLAAMVAEISNRGGELAGLCFTWIGDLEPTFLGNCRGGAVRLAEAEGSLAIITLLVSRREGTLRPIRGYTFIPLTPRWLLRVTYGLSAPPS